MDYSIFTVPLLIGTGFIAGVTNTLAGGGSNLTLRLNWPLKPIQII